MTTVFRTEAGSTYTCVLGSTIRKRPGRKPDEPSRKTLYVDPGQAFALNIRAMVSMMPVEDQIADAGAPLIGLHPVELFADGSVHIGNKIVEVSWKATTTRSEPDRPFA